LRLLITGGTGLIGRALLGELAGEHEVSVLARRPAGGLPGVRWILQDLARPLQTEAWPSRMDCVIHLAQASGGSGSAVDSEDTFTVGVAATFGLLRYALQAGARKFVLASSGGVEALRAPGEERKGTVTAQPAIQFYLRAKACAEILAGDFARTMDVALLRPYFVYGPGQAPPRLIPRLLARVRQGETITTDCRGGPGLNPIFVTDAARAFAQAARAHIPGLTIVDVAGSEVVSLDQIARILGTLAGVEPLIAPEPQRSPEELIGDTRAMREVLGVIPTVGIKEGLERMLAPAAE
jgi:nucleoside-diphosphate-sugar epimerase